MNKILIWIFFLNFFNLSITHQSKAIEIESNDLNKNQIINDESMDLGDDKMVTNNKLEQSYILENDKINPSHFYNSAIIQALDKSTATKSILKINIGSQKKFGNIIIKLHRCWQAPLSQTPESKALIEVIEEVRQNYNVKQEKIFSGWMFASTPSISSLEHPIYDLTILECSND